MLKKLFLLSVLLLLFAGLVSAQQVTSNIPSSPTASFEKMVVKEHFLTKKEIKDYMDKKALEYQKTTDQQIMNAFVEVENVINKKINKFIFKLVLSMIALMFFINSWWYFMKLKLNRKLETIKSLKEERD